LRKHLTSAPVYTAGYVQTVWGVLWCFGH
jgi:hypothetical protein